MDADTKRLVVFAGGVGGVLVLLIAASMLTGHHSGQIPVIAADPAPIRVKPENPGGMKIDAAENDVFSGGTDMGNARLAPPAEAPDPKALRAAEVAETRPAPFHLPTGVAATVPLPAAPPAGASVLPAVPPPPVAPARLAAVPPAPPPAASSAHPAERVAMIEPPAPPKREAVAAKPGTVARVQPVDARADTRMDPRADARLDSRADAKAASGRRVMVQLAAVGSDAEAKAEWERLRTRNHELFEGRQLTISRADRDGHTFWRVRTAGFADVAQARAFCEHIRAKGGGCSIAEF